MNLVRLLTREELISGLEISDTYVRVVLLEKVKTKNKSSDKKTKDTEEKKLLIKCAQEVALSRGVIVGGVLIDQLALAKALRELIKKCGRKIRYAVVSLPPDTVFCKVFGFPKSIQGERLEESMKLTVGFQLPIKTEGAYLDWENIPTSKDNEIFLAMMPQKVVDQYVGALEQAGIKPVAVEFYQTSIARAIEIGNQEAALIKIPTDSSNQLVVLYKQYPYFLRILPKNIFDESKIEEEERKLTDFFEAEKKVRTQVVELKDARIIYDLYDNPAIKQNNGGWLIAAGAALRGLIPRSEDALVSLMSVGTEEAYSYQKASTFAGFLSNIAIVVSIFFVAVFVGLWVFMVSAQQSVTKQVESMSAAPASAESVQLEGRAQKINGLLGVVGGLVKTFPKWDGVIEEIKARTVSGIVVTNLSLRNPDEPITLSGVAQNRAQLNLFKKSMEESPMFAGTEIPLTNLGQKDSIPFTATLKLKDPQAIYQR